MEGKLVNGNKLEVTQEAQNGDMDYANEGDESLLAQSVHPHDRIKRKAKRPSKQINVEVSTTGSTGNTVVFRGSNSLQKNSRKPRNGYGRGLPKKGGAGGKGVWGRPGMELTEAEVEEADPNYDSDSLDNNEVELKPLIVVLGEEEIMKKLEPIIMEYFDSCDMNEVVQSLDELNFGHNKYMIPMMAVELAMDHKPSHREMTSVLISDLYLRVISQKDIAKAFDLLLKNLEDLILDTPEAPLILGNFIARAVADDCLPPKYVQSYKGKVESEYAREALSRADTLLSMKHGLVRLDSVWGVGGGIRPVKYLIKKIVLLLKEYLSSGDIHEATRCLVDLEVPHFHHELVYEAVVMTIEAMNVNTEETMCKLLKSMYASVIITPDQFRNGFMRVIDDLPDICLDVPAAYSILERFANRCLACGIIGEDLVKKVPSRGRKRFVSEGDGGKIKESAFL